MRDEIDIKIGIFVEKKHNAEGGTEGPFLSEVRPGQIQSLSFIDKESHQQFVDNLFSIVIGEDE
jgi:hypothetical protein